MSLTMVYWLCLGIGLILVVVSAIFDGLFDFDVDAGGPLTGPVLSMFLVCFGGAGLITYRTMGMGAVASALSSGIISVMASGAFYYLFYKVLLSQEGGTTFDPTGTVGRAADVITEIPADGMGEITFDASSGRISAAARSVGKVVIPRGTLVVIENVVAGIYLVRPYDSPSPDSGEMRIEAEAAAQEAPEEGAPGDGRPGDAENPPARE